MMLRFMIVGLAGLAIVPTSALRPHDPTAVPEAPFCDRNPHTCAATSEVMDGLKTKLTLIAAMAARNFNGDPVVADPRKLSEGRTHARPEPTRASGNLPALPIIIEGLIQSGTLTETDRAPAWRMPE